jgi:undecaprenyl-diphosphatase
MPLAVLGLAFGKAIKAQLFQPVPVALAFIVGGFIILWAEKREHTVRVLEVEDLSWCGRPPASCCIKGLCRPAAQ